MKNITLLLIGVWVIFWSVGCGEGGGLLIKPVPTDRTLQETTVKAGRGLFVAEKVLIVDIDGTLVNSRGGLFGTGENPVSLFIEKIDKAQADTNVKAIVLRINSPGGGVTASDIMHNRLIQLKAKRKIPIVAIIQGVGASGGYYVACGADRIIAHPTSITGSIGVMIQTFSLAGTMNLIGIDAQAITSGPHKDMGNPLKPLDPEDQKILQGIVDEYYERFLSVVGKGRPKLNAETIRTLADGRVYTGGQAVESGLVDSLGYMDDAIKVARKMAGLKRAKLVIYNRPMGHKPHAYASTSAPGAQLNLLNINVPNLDILTQPRFLYLWTGRTGGPAN